MSPGSRALRTGRPGSLHTVMPLFLWVRWALRCGPLRPTAKARRLTRRWWCWTSADALRCPFSPAIWAGPTSWRGGWPLCAARCRSLPLPRMQTVCLRWMNGPDTRTVPCWSRSASKRSAAHCWRAERCGSHPTGPLRAARLRALQKMQRPRSLPSPCARREMLCILCRASACWGWGAGAAPAPTRWPKPLRPSAHRQALPRSASRRRPASI